MLDLMAAADAAEARGDAAAALEVMCRETMDDNGRLFWRPWRISRLDQLITLEPLLPRWAISRWILEQATQALDPAMRRGHAAARAVAIELRGGRAALPGIDERDAMARIIESDWVYRQLVLYDHGGLASFLRRLAAGDLVAGADRIHDWVGVPMRAFRFERREPTVLHWTDLTTGEPVTVPNLGAAALVLPGEHVIGRLVPTAEGRMFEGIPLGVPAEVAAAVAEGAGDWVGALRRQAADHPDELATTIVRGNQLVTDVPDLVWRHVVLDSAGDWDPRSDGWEVFVEGAIGLVRAAMTGGLESRDSDELLDPWPCLGAVLCHPPTLERLWREFGPADAPGLLALAERIFGPGGAVCRELAATALAAA